MIRDPDAVEQRAMAADAVRGRAAGEPSAWDETIAGRVAARFRPVPEFRSNVTDADMSSAWVEHTGGVTPAYRRQVEARALAEYHRDPRRFISAELGDVFGEIRRHDPEFEYSVVHQSAGGGIGMRQTRPDGTVAYTGSPEMIERMREGDRQAAAFHARALARENAMPMLKQVR